MIVALGISLLAIFLILMIQFRNLTEPLVVMLSIPLSLFGMVVGLLVTRNTFGFTAFMGMIALCGIVVRNAIILIDYIKERLRDGVPLAEAATQAGERRLRPDLPHHHGRRRGRHAHDPVRLQALEPPGQRAGGGPGLLHVLHPAGGSRDLRAACSAERAGPS